MADVHSSNEDFLTGLIKLLEAAHKSGHGSIFLTQKRYTYGTTMKTESDSSSEDGLFPDFNLSEPVPIIVRATNGKGKEKRLEGEKVKISTIVEPNEIEGFFTRYADVCKMGMQGMKKRDRSKRKKGKDKKKGGEKKG
ncbi:signal recognition particle, SRP9/SRP14 subunit [Tothia fuscella]|uniref:Signal recognition particle subunit SRP14 n=1 Tax=Tothia fuscella TaxID=1048955 RepID=A0A9P4TW85_9PEZI|nr:signal recognition particle, SRP9/SRP14 subunit [Tothia fuscella]